MSFLKKRSDEKQSEEEPSEPKTDKLLTAKQAGEILGLSASALYQGKGGTGQLTRLKLSRKVIRWSQNEVLEFIQLRLALARAEQRSEYVPEPRAKVLKIRGQKPSLTKQEIDEICRPFRVGNGNTAKREESDSFFKRRF